ncbi:sigma 54-interacting transcriptional regulator [Oceanidesulfovibrio marinus]|nr:sigma 54-interacting transcriptional regulator [Oceanidesulfovibrio marinus]
MSVPNQYLHILDSVSYAIVTMDLDCRVTYLNERAKIFLTGRGRDHYRVGIEAESILPLAAPQARKAMQTEEFRHGDGRIVDRGEELFFEITPLMADGVLAGAVVSLQRPERFEELATKLDSHRRLSKQLQTIFDASSDGIWVCDGDGIVISINRASEQINGIRAEAVIGRNVETIVLSGMVDRSVTVEVLRCKEQVSIMQHIKRTEKELLVTGTPAFDEKGEINLVVVNERDVTDLNRLKSNLESMTRAKEKAQDELTGFMMLELDQAGIVAESKAMRKLLTTAMKLAQLDASGILLLGESGTGKSLAAKFIHKNSPRRDKPFISINCAALPESLFEAELFGHEKGAFTGASERGKIGLIGLAGDGTLFLDEVGELPLSVQAKLLKCLDENEYLPVGGRTPKKMQCSIIAATNRDLELMVRKNRFRQDLFYRLNTFVLSIPPLRERMEDLFELTSHYLTVYNEKFGQTKRFTTRTLDIFQAYPFPGNVRELVNIIKKGVALHDGDVLDEFFEDALHSPSGDSPSRELSLSQELDRAERLALQRAVAACSTTRQVAALLGTSQPTVVRKLKKHGLSL